MSKSMLVIETPENCYDCILSRGTKCYAVYEWIHNLFDKPEWCPLQPYKEVINE